MQLQKGETFTDVSPGKTVTSTRLNNHVDAAVLLKGAVTEQAELTITAADDVVLISDVSDLVTALPKKVQLTNLLPESIRQGVPQYAAGTLSGGVYAVTLSPAATAYTAGMVVRFKADSANAGAVDINVNAIAARNLFTRAGGELAANDILAGQIVEAVYDGTQFIISQVLSASEVTATHCAEANRQAVHQHAAGAYGAGVYAVTLAPAATAYTAGMVVRFTADTGNAGAADVAVNGLAAKNIFKSDGASELVAGDILAGQLVTLVYDGTNFQFQGATRSWDFTATAAATLAAGVQTFAHGLGVVPTKVRGVFLCTTAQSPFGEAAEVDLGAGFDSGGSAPRQTVWADATNVYAVLRDTGIKVVSASGADTTLTAGSWKVKVYASR